MERRLHIIGLRPEESGSGEWELWLAERASEMAGLLYKTPDKNEFELVTEIVTENIGQLMDMAANIYDTPPTHGTAIVYREGELQKITHKDYGGVKT